MCEPYEVVSNCTVSFFVMKCANLESLQKCIQTSRWAYRHRDKPPQPHDLLSTAHKKGTVVLIFSVNGQHGWHGFCDSLYPSLEKDKLCENKKTSPDLLQEDVPVDKLSLSPDADDCKLTAEEFIAWCYFPVKWLVHYQNYNALSCLDFKFTDHLVLPSGLQVNKARNWQELPPHIGSELCKKMEDHLAKLVANKEEKLSNSIPVSYFKEEARVKSVENKDGVWTAVIEKVSKDLGQVHLACPFGSQRYNCNNSESDLDIFILYQAKTTDILSLDPPQQTLKNSHHEEVDYSVLEFQRYCESLVKGDTKCVETLFLADTPVLVAASEAWKKLCSVRHNIVTKQCLDKYMKEIQGTTGLKQFYRWREANSEMEELTPKLVKLGYIVLRLLQNARDIVRNSQLQVFRPDTSEERQELLAIREGRYTYTQFMEIVHRYLSEIEDHKEKEFAKEGDAKSAVQDWLLRCRLQNLERDPTTMEYLMQNVTT